MRRFCTDLFARKKSLFFILKLYKHKCYRYIGFSHSHSLFNPSPSLSVPSFILSPLTFCSVSSQLDCKISSTDVRNWGSVSDVAKFYEAIISNSNAYDNMEKALGNLGVPLSTDSVVGVLQRLQFEEKIAFRFFMWAGLQDNYAYEPLTYNLMIDIVSSTKYKAKQFQLVCNMIEMGNNGCPPDIVTYYCFLKVLCDNKNSDEALRLYGRTIEVSCLSSVHTYNMLISMFFGLGKPDGAFETWHEMDRRGCAQDIDIYCVMIDGLFDSVKQKKLAFCWKRL